MRNFSAIDQASPPRYRVLLLLLIQILVALAAPTHNNPSGHALTTSSYETVTGGTSLEIKQLLKSRCTKRYVSMRHNGNIMANTTIEDTNKTDPYAVLIFVSHGSGRGRVRIKGGITKKFLCFSKRGRLIDRENPASNDKKCIFLEKPFGRFVELHSVANPDWKVGFHKTKGHRIIPPYDDKNPNCFMFTKLWIPQISEIFIANGNKYNITNASNFPKG